eukprot:scaffold4716_cov109-Isochrysis_galbana.AAC.9
MFTPLHGRREGKHSHSPHVLCLRPRTLPPCISLTPPSPDHCFRLVEHSPPFLRPSLSCVKELLSRRASPNIASSCGLVPLQAASTAAHVSIAQLLSHAGADEAALGKPNYSALPPPQPHALAPFALPGASEVPYFDFPQLPDPPLQYPDAEAAAFGGLDAATGAEHGSGADGSGRGAVGAVAEEDSSGGRAEGSSGGRAEGGGGAGGSELERKREERKREFAARRAALAAEQEAFNATVPVGALPDVAQILCPDARPDARPPVAPSPVMTETDAGLAPAAARGRGAAAAAAAAAAETRAALAGFSRAASLSAAGAASDLAGVFGAKAAAPDGLSREARAETRDATGGQ